MSAGGETLPDDDDVPLLGTGVDQGGAIVLYGEQEQEVHADGSEKEGDGDGGVLQAASTPTPRRRKTCKQPSPGQPSMLHGNKVEKGTLKIRKKKKEQKDKRTKIERRKKKKARRTIPDDDDDNDGQEGTKYEEDEEKSQGEADERDDEHTSRRRRKGRKRQQVVESPPKQPKAVKNDMKGKGKSKGKGKGKKNGCDEKEEKGKGSPRRELRDRSKAKKFNELWSSLPPEVQSHWCGLKRQGQTDFVNACIERTPDGRLVAKTQTMFDLIIETEENQRGLEKMIGYALEEPINYP